MFEFTDCCGIEKTKSKLNNLSFLSLCTKVRRLRKDKKVRGKGRKDLGKMDKGRSMKNILFTSIYTLCIKCMQTYYCVRVTLLEVHCTIYYKQSILHGVQKGGYLNSNLKV